MANGGTLNTPASHNEVALRGNVTLVMPRNPRAGPRQQFWECD